MTVIGAGTFVVTLYTTTVALNGVAGIFHAEISRMWWKEVFFEPEEVHCATIYCGLIYYIFYHNWKNENAASGKEGMRIYVLFGIYYKAKCIFLRFRPLFAHNFPFKKLS